MKTIVNIHSKEMAEDNYETLCNHSLLTFRMFAMLLLHCLIFACVAHAQISATLSAEPSIYSGICPAEIKFRGTVTSEKAGRVQYRFIRSDGTLSPVETIEFSTPGAKEVKGLWMAGDASTTLYEGWQAIRIVYPEEVESKEAKFKVTCDQSAPELTVKIWNSPASARPGHELGSSFNVKVTNHGKFDLRDVTIDIVLKKDNSCPISTPNVIDSAHFLDGAPLKGEREQVSLKAGQQLEIKLNGTNKIPADTPIGNYYLCAVANEGNQIKESDKTSCACHPIHITTAAGKIDLVIDRISFKVGGKCEPNYPLYIFEVTVKNIGTAPSPLLLNKTLVQVMDMHDNRWGNGATLSSIPPGGRQTVLIPVYYFTEDPIYMTKMVPHPFRAVVDPLHLIEEANRKNNTSDIIYLDPGLICPK